MFGLDKKPEVSVVFGTYTVKLVENILYLGVLLSKDESNEKGIIDKRAATVTQTLNTCLNLSGSKTPIIPSLSSKFYDAVCVPKIMYGLESCDIAKKNINILEKVQVESACRIQRLSKNIAQPVPLANIGWLSVTPLLHISQLAIVRLESKVRISKIDNFAFYKFSENIPEGAP